MVLQFSKDKISARSSSRIITKESEKFFLVYEILHKTNLYDLCLEILLTTRLEEILVDKFRLRHSL